MKSAITRASGRSCIGSARTSMRGLMTAVVASSLLLPQAAPARQGERFAAIMTAGPLNPAALGIEIGVDRWSTDELRASLYDIFRSGGQPALLSAVKKEKVAGYVRAQGRARLQAGYVQEEPRPDGGRRILMLFVRYHGDWEV